jgi:hypothetical protein
MERTVSKIEDLKSAFSFTKKLRDGKAQDQATLFLMEAEEDEEL